MNNDPVDTLLEEYYKIGGRIFARYCLKESKNKKYLAREEANKILGNIFNDEHDDVQDADLKMMREYARAINQIS